MEIIRLGILLRKGDALKTKVIQLQDFIEQVGVSPDLVYSLLASLSFTLLHLFSPVSWTYSAQFPESIYYNNTNTENKVILLHVKK